MTHIVYLVKNKITGDEYIGATKHDISYRRKKHEYDAKSERHGCHRFWRAIRKYGEDTFEWSVLVKCSDANHAAEEEIRLIAERRPVYNITRGGRGMVGIPRTKEWIEKAAAANRGQKRSQEVIEKIRLRSQENMRRSIVCLDDGKFFDGIKRAALHYGISAKSIQEVRAGRQMLAGGLAFVASDRQLSEEEIRAHLNENAERRKRSAESVCANRSRAVVRTTDNVFFSSAALAATKSGISRARVMQLCQIGGSTGEGWAFRYADSNAVQKRQLTQQEKDRARALSIEALRRGQRKIKKKVVCVDDGAVFGSITDAARTYDIHISAISAAIYRNGKASGKTFQFAE